MGRLLKSLFICGGTSYQKFDNNIDKSDYLCYKCENCGHQGTVKVRSLLLFFVVNFDFFLDHNVLCKFSEFVCG